MSRVGKFGGLAEIRKTDQKENRGPKGGVLRGGRRSDPRFCAFNGYIRKDVHRQAMSVLFENREQNFSELVQELIEAWLKSQGRYNGIAIGD